jgi:acetylornithine deacetylase/succinyl-diaminopimelate desuccinylase-like protein
MDDYIEDRWTSSIVPQLERYIEIPNKSPAFDEAWEKHGFMQQAVEHLAAWVAQSPVQGMHHEIITLPGRTPVLFAEIDAFPGARATAQQSEASILLYGHYDKQPEFEGWEADLGPWQPVLRDGRLYGRGGADDGYAVFASLCAIEAAQRQNIAHPRCVLLIEGCEESGSFDLPHYVEHLRTRIGQPRLVICLDAECGNYDQLWITTSLRGMLPGKLNVQILTEGQHSGVAGGIVPSSFRILRHLLDRVENSTTGELNKVLHATIPVAARRAAEHVAQVLGPEIIQRFPWVSGAHPDTDDLTQILLNNSWHPSLATVGLGGAPALADAGNTLRPNTAAKLVFRLPPTVDAQAAASAIKEILEQDPPYGAAVEFTVETPQTGWCAPEQAQWLQQALQQASQNHFGKPVMHMGMGGTIPFMKMLGDAYPDTQFVVTGVLGPKSNAHGPNEFLHIDTAKRLTACVVDIIGAAGAEFA